MTLIDIVQHSAPNFRNSCTHFHIWHVVHSVMRREFYISVYTYGHAIKVYFKHMSDVARKCITLTMKKATLSIIVNKEPVTSMSIEFGDYY